MVWDLQQIFVLLGGDAEAEGLVGVGLDLLDDGRLNMQGGFYLRIEKGDELARLPELAVRHARIPQLESGLAPLLWSATRFGGAQN